MFCIRIRNNGSLRYEDGLTNQECLNSSSHVLALESGDEIGGGMSSSQFDSLWLLQFCGLLVLCFWLSALKGGQR